MGTPKRRHKQMLKAVRKRNAHLARKREEKYGNAKVRHYRICKTCDGSKRFAGEECRDCGGEGRVAA